MPDRLPDHPIQRATDHSVLARLADRWRLYSPIIAPLCLGAYAVLIWVQKQTAMQAAMPTAVAAIEARVYALEKADAATAASITAVDAKLTANVGVVDAKVTAVLYQLNALQRSVCAGYTPREKEIGGCPPPATGATGTGIRWTPPAFSVPQPNGGGDPRQEPPAAPPPRSVALRAADDRNALRLALLASRAREPWPGSV